VSLGYLITEANTETMVMLASDTDALWLPTVKLKLVTEYFFSCPLMSVILADG
jgi:hypothetical protein